MTTNVPEFIEALDGGVFEEKISRILSDVAGAVIDHNDKGQVILQLDLKRIGESDQVQIDHAIKYKRPTSKGHVSEVNTTTTPMYVGARGTLSFLPENKDTKPKHDGNVTSIPQAR